MDQFISTRLLPRSQAPSPKIYSYSWFLFFIHFDLTGLIKFDDKCHESIDFILCSISILKAKNNTKENYVSVQ